jgi:hypothetical protein
MVSQLPLQLPFFFLTAAVISSAAVKGEKKKREVEGMWDWRCRTYNFIKTTYDISLNSHISLLPYGFSPQWPIERPMWCPLDKENPGRSGSCTATLKETGLYRPCDSRDFCVLQQPDRKEKCCCRRNLSLWSHGIQFTSRWTISQESVAVGIRPFVRSWKTMPTDRFSRKRDLYQSGIVKMRPSWSTLTS